MFFPDLKQTDIVAFVGKDGVNLLAKALEKVFVESHYSASDLAKSLHLKTRCLLAWLENVSKNYPFTQVPLTQSIDSKNFQDITISFVEPNKTIIRKREHSLHGLGKKNEIIETLENASLPEVAVKLLNLPQYEDELDNSDFINSPELNKTIKLLVDRHIEFLKKSNKLLLNKAETQAECPDCGQSIIIGDKSPKLCICYKFFGNNSIHIVKNETGGLTLHFGKKWDQQNIALFSQALKNKLK